MKKSKEGVYSGALGYFAPDGDFDFNVVILAHCSIIQKSNTFSFL
jgi:anthranilate/para-aminobenzoate synthase component I